MDVSVLYSCQRIIINEIIQHATRSSKNAMKYEKEKKYKYRGGVGELSPCHSPSPQDTMAMTVY